ncbi:lactate racemase domain-containing protein [Desulfatiferula olefinivorans]
MIYPPYIEQPMAFPDFYRVTDIGSATAVDDVETTVCRELDRVLPGSGIEPGHRVAVAVGSRGITDLPLMVRALCRALRGMGAVPVIIPAMGSHGGATGPGQAALLASLGVTEATCGAPVCSSMAVDCMGAILDGVPVYYSRDCLSADHAILINRIKPHTKFKGPVESGLYKMLCIGMGKHEGALALHRAALRHGFNAVIKGAGDLLLRSANLRFALAVVENRQDRPAVIRAVPAYRLFDEEANLLKTAKTLFPRLPFERLDALIIERIGKDISGSGMDPNVTGRAFDLKEDDFSQNLSVTRIGLLDLSEPGDGNAIGLGNADFITEKLYQRMDYGKTLTNALTSLSIRKAFIPIRLRDDRCVIQAAMLTAGVDDPGALRAVIIRNTRDLSPFWASRALLDEVSRLPGVRVEGPFALTFSPSGDLALS